MTGNYVSNPGAIGIAAGPGTTVTGNNVSGNDGAIAIEVGTGSTVIGNTATGGAPTGIAVTCPSNVIDNTSTGHSQNLVLNGEGCNDSNNVAP